jgi:uncharacterized protein YjiS (DUF1127 family)
MFLTLFTRFRQRLVLHASMGWLLRRADDRYLEDIGLTRQQLTDLLRRPVSIPNGAAHQPDCHATYSRRSI